MKAHSAVTGVLLFAVAVSSACIDADERDLQAGQPAGGSAGAKAGAGGGAGAGGTAEGGSVAGSTPSAGAANEAGAGAEPTAGSPSSLGGAAGEDAGGAAGNGPGPVDEGILSEWALWSVPNSPGHNQSNQFNYDTDDADVTIDQITGLNWQKHASVTAVTWQAAMDACDALSLGGHDDWRVPTRMELISLVDFDKVNPATDSDAFPETKADWYWSSTPSSSAPARHWQVDFGGGSVWPEDSAQKYYVRCVQGKTKVPATHYTVGVGVVSDNYTRLMWEMPRPADLETLADAQARCASLTDLGGSSNWRLPSMNELLSLVDVTAVKPALDSAIFTDESGNGMDWSASTTSVGNYWVVQWDGGVTPSVGAQGSNTARCVRIIP